MGINPMPGMKPCRFSKLGHKKSSGTNVRELSNKFQTTRKDTNLRFRHKRPQLLYPPVAGRAKQDISSIYIKKPRRFSRLF